MQFITHSLCSAYRREPRSAFLPHASGGYELLYIYLVVVVLREDESLRYTKQTHFKILFPFVVTTNEQIDEYEQNLFIQKKIFFFYFEMFFYKSIFSIFNLPFCCSSRVHPHHLDIVINSARSYRISPNQIKFEISERNVMSDVCSQTEKKNWPLENVFAITVGRSGRFVVSTLLQTPKTKSEIQQPQQQSTHRGRAHPRVTLPQCLYCLARPSVWIDLL